VSQAECQCLECRGAGPGKRILRAFSTEAAARGWYQRLFGEAAGDFVADVEARLGDRAQARRLIDRLGAEAAVVLAILAEAPEGIRMETLAFEVITLIGAGATQGIDRVHQAGLVFEVRPYDYRNNQQAVLYLLPASLQSWLRPVLGGLLAASRPTPPVEPSPHSARDANWPEAMTLAAVASLRPRLTSGRLFKKDGERLAGLLAPANLPQPPEAIIDRLRQLHLLACDDSEPTRLEPDWTALAAWAERAAAELVRERLGFLHVGVPAWSSLVEAGGDWVEEIHLARGFRIARRIVPPPGRTTGSLTEKTWALERERTLATWPEVERLERDGTVFWRVRPALLASGGGGAARAHVQPDFEIVAPPEMALRDHGMQARVAELRRPDVVATFALTAASARRAAAGGLGGARIADGLRAIAAHGLPPSVERAIRDWTGDIGRCALRVAVLISFDESSLADRAATLLGPAVERVGPCSLAAPEHLEVEIERRLIEAGMAPRSSPDGESADDDDDLDDSDDDLSMPWSPPPKHREASAAEPPDPRWVAAVRGLRARGESRAAPVGFSISPGASAPPPSTGAQPGAPSRGSAARPPALRPLPPLVAMQRGLLYGADVIVERAGRKVTVQPLRAASDHPAPDFEVAVAGGQGTEIVRLQEVQSAFLVPSTARLVARNHLCPCGSGRKFKRCCLDPGLAGVDGEAPQPGP